MANKCRKCGGEMKQGQALQSTMVEGMADFVGVKNNVVTISEGGPGKLVSCFKCADCGWSVTGTMPAFFDHSTQR